MSRLGSVRRSASVATNSSAATPNVIVSAMRRPSSYASSVSTNSAAVPTGSSTERDGNGASQWGHRPRQRA